MHWVRGRVGPCRVDLNAVAKRKSHHCCKIEATGKKFFHEKEMEF
jgi:hypothetical protein